MSISLIDSISDAGSIHKANEDLIVEAQDLCVVLDGATGLGEQRILSHPSDAVWFVEVISARLAEAWSREGNFARALTSAIDMCIEEYTDITGALDQLPYEIPSAGMVAAAVEDGFIRLYRLGDCVAYYKDEKKVEKLFGYSRLEALDKLSIEAIADKLRYGLNPKQARQAILPMLRKHRSLLNVPGGYGALSLTRDCMRYMETFELPRVESAMIVLASDGFSAIEQYRGYEAADIFNRCNKAGLSGIIDEIREIEGGDEGLMKFSRLKAHDDATAILARVD